MISKNGFNAGWYLNRLSVMERGEWIHRIKEQCSIQVMHLKYQMKKQIDEKIRHDYEQFGFCAGSTSKFSPCIRWSFNLSSEERRDLLAGKIKTPGFEWIFRSENTIWNEAPDTGKIWPASFFGSIPYRIGNPCGDIRVAWEPSRLQHLIGLALLSIEGAPDEEKQSIELLETQFLSWVSANPFMKGIHYISMMECGLRIISLCHALDMVRNKLKQPERVWSAFLKLVEEHAGLIEKRLSLYSSRGNHTIAEAAGLVYAGILFPEMEGALRWKVIGLTLLEEESRREILPDGGGVEQSLGYLLFILDLLGLVVWLLEHSGEKIPSAILGAFFRGKQFINRFGNSPQQLPLMGDYDHGHALSPFLRISWNEEGTDPDVETFKESGYSIIRSQTPDSAMLIFDHGPLGMPPSFGHGHADALSVVFKSGGEEILADPGTFSYSQDARWRAYFRSTRAHNTVTVDGQDQASQKTSFIWSEPFHSRLLLSEKTGDRGIRILAGHDGYTRFAEKVEHFRAVCFTPPGHWLIWDFLTGEGAHTLDLHWHLGIQLLKRKGGRFFLELPREISLEVSGGEVSLFKGETDPILGWRSPVYGKKEPATTIQVRYQGKLPHEFITKIQFGPDSGEVDPDSAQLSFLRGCVDETQKS
ncbi:MAG: alginate lyase family protein [Nitrospiria bacterium]